MILISERELTKIVYQYNSNELMDTVLTYGAANINYELAARLYY